MSKAYVEHCMHWALPCFAALVVCCMYGDAGKAFMGLCALFPSQYSFGFPISPTSDASYPSHHFEPIELRNIWEAGQYCCSTERDGRASISSDAMVERGFMGGKFRKGIWVRFKAVFWIAREEMCTARATQ